MKKIVLLLFMVAFFVSGCVPTSEYEKVLAELEECRFGEAKMHKEAVNFIKLGEIENAKEKLQLLLDKYPASDSASMWMTTLSDVKKEIKKQADEAETLAFEEKKQRVAKAAAEDKAKQAKIAKALKAVRKKHDDVSGTTWYKNRYFTHYSNTNLTSVYMGEKSGSVWLRLQMSYTGDDWIFFEKAYLSYDGNTLEVPFEKYTEKETDNGTGGVWEWIDVSIDDYSDIVFLKQLAKSKKAKMRLTGKYTKTRNLTWNERQGITDILNAYEILDQSKAKSNH